MSIIENFNDITLDFLNQMAPLTGRKYYYKYSFAIKFNSSYGIDSFIENVLQFKQKIINRDESFFLNQDVNSDYINDFIGIKDCYYTLDHKSKKSIWEILSTLVYLAEERYMHSILQI
jgi:hypothetical protein